MILIFVLAKAFRSHKFTYENAFCTVQKQTVDKSAALW